MSSTAGSGQKGWTNGAAQKSTFFLPAGAVFDAKRKVLVIADTGNHRIRVLDLAKDEVSTLAGGAGAGNPGYADGKAESAQFSSPWSVCIDPTDGSYLVADTENHAIRRVTTDGVATTVAGGGPNSAGFANGAGAAAKFNGPISVLCDQKGTIYVSDRGNHRLRKIEHTSDKTKGAAAAAVVVSTATGSGVAKIADGGTNVAALEGPRFMCWADGGGDAAAPAIYVTCEGGAIRKYDLKTNTLSTMCVYPQVNGWGIAHVAPYLIVTDTFNTHGVFAIDARSPQQLITRVAGRTGNAGTCDGPYAAFANPLGLCSAAPAAPASAAAGPTSAGSSAGPTSESLYVIDKGNSRIRRVDLIKTVADSQFADLKTAAEKAAQQNNKKEDTKSAAAPAPATPTTPSSPTVTHPDVPTISTIAGVAQTESFADAPNGCDARFSGAVGGIAFDPIANAVVVADTGYTRVRKIDIKTSEHAVKTIAGGEKRSASIEAKAVANDANSQQLTKPTTVCVDPREANCYFVIDLWAHALRRINAQSVLVTVAGGKMGKQNGSGAGGVAQFHNPSHAVVDPQSGSIYVADSGNHLIRRIDRSNTTGAYDVVTAIGNGKPENRDGTGADEKATAAIKKPLALTLTPDSSALFIACEGGIIRKLAVKTGLLSTIATTPPLLAMTGIAHSGVSQYLFVSDKQAGVFVVDPKTGAAIEITPVAAASATGTGSGGEDAKVKSACGLAYDPIGCVLYITEPNRVRKIALPAVYLKPRF